MSGMEAARVTTRSSKVSLHLPEKHFLECTLAEKHFLNVHFLECTFGRMDIFPKTYFPELTLARMYIWPN